MTELDLANPLIVGFGITAQAVARALLQRNFTPVVVDDRPTDSSRTAARDLELTLVEKPDQDRWVELLSSASVLLPSPGVPDHHPAFALAARAGVPVASEFDLAQCWDQRPTVAITGTNGKTTVTMMVTDALERSGISAAAVGNTEVPLVAAIDDDSIEVFVVEASSFRLDHSLGFKPSVATWLNFSADHQDAHASLQAYEDSKAAIWSLHDETSIAIVADLDPVVRRHAPQRGSVQTFGGPTSDWRVEDDHLVGPIGRIERIDALVRQQPHDLANALAAAATALAVGATVDGVSEMLRTFEGLDHRVAPVGEFDGVRWLNDSKATSPHATLAAIAGHDSVVLIAGGKNKGLDLSLLRDSVPPVKAVVAIGDSAPEVAAVFEGLVPIRVGETMDEAIVHADQLSEAGDVVLLSPSCASFDWYSNYAERGQDFARRVIGRFAP